jgi:Tol biopolymer transport system component
VAAAVWILGRPLPAEPRWSHFTRITEAAGEETAPTLSPDGQTVAYAVRVNGSWDIHAQRVGGQNASALINDPDRHEAGPRFSPDGTLIAFHESEGEGGIFVAGATGESVRRVTDTGFEPSWSPDGKQIAYATEEVIDPASRISVSELFVVPLAGGPARRLVEGDAVQPSWSPSGRRIVYWSNTGGQRDIFTVASDGGPRVALTSDPAIDWCPVWAPDGTSIYFASDRGGAMNLWRIPVDEASGEARGDAEPVTVGVQAAIGLPAMSRDGSRLAFRSRVASVNPVAVPLDPASLRAGTPVLLDTQNNVRVPSGVSPDGKHIAYYSIGDRQEDLFIGTPDGRMRRVTDDPPRDRAPIFTPDGRTLLFYSNRDGAWGIWAVGVDGGNLRKVLTPPEQAVYIQISPAGDRIAFVDMSGRFAFVAPYPPPPGTEPARLPGSEVGGKYFSPNDWSRDGRRLAGTLVHGSGRPGGVGVYDIATATATELATEEVYAVKWLSDSRRVAYFAAEGRDLVVLDTVTRQRTVLDVRLPASGIINEMFAISPDDRAIYYGAIRSEADIWILERR